MEVTETPPLQSQSQILRRFLTLSFALHFLAFFYLALKSLFFPETPKEYLPSIRVDLVGLPTQKKSEIPEPKPVEPVKAAPKTVAPPEKKPILKAESDAGDFSVALKKKKKLERAKKEKEAQRKLKQAIERIRAIERVKALAGGEEIQGNRISKGSALTGEAKTALETTYFDVVLERVRSNWELPKWLQDQNLSAKVMIYLDSRGNLRSLKFVKPSGNEQFDGEVKRTLQASSPFPLPPSAIASDLSAEGILLGFPL